MFLHMGLVRSFFGTGFFVQIQADNISEEEIDDTLNPKHGVFKADIFQWGVFGVDTYKPIDTESGREDITDGFPERGYGGTRPWNSADEKQGDWGEDKDEHGYLSVSYQRAEKEGKEYAGQ